MLKALTRIEEAEFGEAFNSMFSTWWHSVKRLHSSFPCCEL